MNGIKMRVWAAAAELGSVSSLNAVYTEFKYK